MAKEKELKDLLDVLWNKGIRTVTFRVEIGEATENFYLRFVDLPDSIPDKIKELVVYVQNSSVSVSDEISQREEVNF